MSRGRTAREPGDAPTGGQHRLPGGPQASTHRSGRGIRGPQDRQRPIRYTLTVLLIIPLVSLVALWAYAASGTVGAAIGKRSSDTANRIIGAPTQALFQELVLERTDTFIWLSAHRQMPRAGLDAQRKHTDAAVAAFGAAAAKAAGVQVPLARSAMATVVARFGQLPQIRAAVDAGTLQPLAAFQAYNGVYDASFTLGHGALADPGMGVVLYEQGEGAADEGEALEYIGREAALVGGALVSGGRMSAAEHQLFAQYVGEQRLLEQVGESPGYWQQNQDPYLQVFASPVYRRFKAMEDRIAAASPGARIPVSPVAWQSGLTSLMGPFISAETLARADTTRGASHAGNVILLRLFIVGGAGLAAVILSALLLLGFGNRITRELTGFKKAVRALADERLPAVVSRLRAGEDVDVDTEAPPLALRTRTREVTETADAFSAVQRTAVEAAVGQAQLRKGVSNVFRSLARRNQSLLQRQLKMLDEMERGTHDPEALAQLFRLDQLTTRMRRQAEGLIILSGSAAGRGWRQPVPVVEVLRGAIGEIEDYVRVDMVTDSHDLIPGAAVADVTHLLAELIENATLYSPPNTRVRVSASRVANGFVVEIEDRGLGIPAETLAVLNDRLVRPPEFDLADSDQLGLFVVSRLAARHGIKISLRGSAYGGTASIVLLPHHLVVTEEDPVAQTPAPAAVAALGRAADTAATRPSPRLELNARAGYAEPGSVRTQLPPWAERPDETTAPAQQTASPDGRMPASADSPLGLPRRMRQANLAPQLRDAPPAAVGGQHEARSADQVRAMISSIQQGWRSGRAAADRLEEDPPPGNPGSGQGEAGR